jgi:hypothetical protein
MGDDGRALVLSLSARLTVRISPDEVWEARVELLGRFSSSLELTSDDGEYFASSSGLYVLWPFARADIDALARLAGVQAPPLPLLIRPPR